MMHRLLALCGLAAIIAGCDGGPGGDAQQELQASPAGTRSAAESSAPPQSLAIDLEPMTMADVEKYDLFGVGCVFEPAGAGRDRWTVITGDGDAHVKRGGMLVRLIAQPGAEEIAWLAVTRYATGSLVLDIRPGPGTARTTGEESSEQQATVSLRDTTSGARYLESGMLDCGA